MLNMKTLLATSAIVMTAGIANAQVVTDTTSTDMTLSVAGLPAFCSLTPGSTGAAAFDNLTWNFTPSVPATAGISFRGMQYVIIDAPDDIIAPDTSTVASAISDIAYAGSMDFVSTGTLAVVDYIGGLGDGDAAIVDLAVYAPTSDEGTLSILPTLIDMDELNFVPTQENVDYSVVYTVTCYE